MLITTDVRNSDVVILLLWPAPLSHIADAACCLTFAASRFCCLQSVVALITTDVHNRDVVTSLLLWPTAWSHIAGSACCLTLLLLAVCCGVDHD
jgi:hypothetical protein